MKVQLPFGQPLGGIMQVAYIVEDLRAAAMSWAETLKVGPFFIIEHFPLADMTYRGKPDAMDISVALAHSGSMCFELIKQNDDKPSVYQDVVKKRGYGFHHWAVSTRDFEGTVEGYKKQGFEQALYARVPSVNGRAAYIDTVAANGGMIEIIEINPAVENLFATIKQAADTWDGSSPLRSFA